MPTAMIVLASEQLWPNVLGLLHFARQQEGVQRLFIYHTAADRQSVQPARRLQKFCAAHFPSLEVVLSGPCGIEPQDVLCQIETWQKQFPDWHWLINATGGLKLATFAVSDLTPSPADDKLRLFYRELNGQWFLLQRAPSGTIASRAMVVPPELSREISIEDAVLLQTGYAWQCGEVHPLHLPDVVRCGMAHDWDWQRMAQEMNFSVPKVVRLGATLFEHFVANVLQKIGAGQVAIDLCTNSVRPEEQNDVICLHGDRLYLYDCKLTTEQQSIERASRSEKTALITEAYDAWKRAHNLGGTGASAILLRPSRHLAAAHNTQHAKEFFRKSHNLTIWDKEEMRDFLPQLNNQLKLKEENWHDEAREAAHLLAEEVKARRTVITGHFEQRVRSDEKQGDFFDPVKAVENYATHLHPHWHGYQIAGVVHLWLHKSQEWSDEEKVAMTSRLREYGTLQNNTPKKRQNVLIIEVRANGPARKRLFKALNEGALTW